MSSDRWDREMAADMDMDMEQTGLGRWMPARFYPQSQSADPAGRNE